MATARQRSAAGRRWQAIAALGLVGASLLGGCSSADEVHLDPLPAESDDSSAITTATTMATAPAGTAADTTATPVADPVRFETLPVGAELPGDEQCAALVRPVPDEIRPANTRYNLTPGNPTAADADPNYPRYGRVTGAFTGTTDEILQWVACKWGIDEDVVRAQTAKESYWFQRNVGDFTTDTSRCVPGHELGEDGRDGECPESIGIMQVRYPYFVATIADAVTSTAYNLDIAYAVWRTCFEGEEEWLGEVDRGQEYVAGDMWGCVGRWFAGRWYTEPALEYMGAVQEYYEGRIWERGDFIAYTG